MENFFALVYGAGLIAFWLGVAMNLWRLVQIASRVGLSSAVRHFLISLALATACYLPAAFAGAWAFCSPTAWGLCALGGFVGTGPLAAGALLIYRAL
ncbi:MAG TPA: hypothetical protein VFR91_09080 [Dyella sp.]|nr:hypothetical protein [Dyella sp.]